MLWEVPQSSNLCNRNWTRHGLAENCHSATRTRSGSRALGCVGLEAHARRLRIHEQNLMLPGSAIIIYPLQPNLGAGSTIMICTGFRFRSRLLSPRSADSRGCSDRHVPVWHWQRDATTMPAVDICLQMSTYIIVSMLCGDLDFGSVAQLDMVKMERA